MSRADERLRAVVEVGRGLAGLLDLDPLLNLIVEKTSEAMAADRASLFLIDWESEELWSKVAKGVGYRELRFPMGAGLAGHVATTGETLNVPDAYEDARFNQEFDRSTGYRTRSILGVPMTDREGARIGVLQVLNRLDGEPFDAPDEELMGALAGQAAVAIENSQLYEEQKASFLSFVETLSAAMDARDPITAGHSLRVTEYTLLIAASLGWAERDLETLRVAGLLHDVGKIGVPEAVLWKDGRLDGEEYKIIQGHARHTLEILSNIRFARDQREIPMMAATHHERIDGKGYPLGLSGGEIPVAGRIMAVGDVFDAITSKRHYRDRMDFGKVLAILQEGRGTQFEAEFVDAFLALPLGKVTAVMEPGGEPIAADALLSLASITLGGLGEVLGKEPATRSEEEAAIACTFLDHYTQDLPDDYEEMD